MPRFLIEMEVFVDAKNEEEAMEIASKLVNLKLPENLENAIVKRKAYKPKLEAQENPYGKCPKCGSNLIDQQHSDSGDSHTWYHCYECSRWYNEEGYTDA